MGLYEFLLALLKPLVDWFVGWFPSSAAKLDNAVRWKQELCLAHSPPVVMLYTGRKIGPLGRDYNWKCPECGHIRLATGIYAAEIALPWSR